MKNEKLLLFGFVLGIIGLCVCGVLLINSENAKERLERDISYIRSRNLSLQGATSLYNGKMFSYYLRSFDSGKTWYACETKSDSVIILGNAETIYPGLVKHLAAWDKITKIAEQHGSIKKIDDDMEELLKDAHIKVVKNGN